MFGVKRSDLISIFIIIIITCAVVRVAVPLPLSEQAKEAQRMTTCQNNMKRCSTALHMYWTDYDAMLPSSYVSKKPAGTPTQADVVKFLTGKDPWPVPDDAYYGTQQLSWAQMVYPHLYKKNVMFCPSDTPGTRVSYWWKYAVDLAWRDSVMSCRREGDFAYAASQVILYEHSAWHSGDAAGIKSGVKINVAYMDSHVSTVTIKNGPAAYPSAEDERSGLSSIRPGSPMYYNYNMQTQQQAVGEAVWIDPRYYADKF